MERVWLLIENGCVLQPYQRMVCLLYAEKAINVEVVDARTGRPPRRGATLIVREGAYADTSSTEGPLRTGAGEQEHVHVPQPENGRVPMKLKCVRRAIIRGESAGSWCAGGSAMSSPRYSVRTCSRGPEAWEGDLGSADGELSSGLFMRAEPPPAAHDRNQT
jgi:hypothetical protein